jgi:carboxymethylenebutenolidase
MQVTSLQGINHFSSRLPARRKLMNSAAGVAWYLIAVLLAGLNAWAAPSNLRQEGQQANLDNETVNYDSGRTHISAFLAKPQGTGKHPAIIVIHDNQGLTDGVRDVARQLAAAGFVALAPDLLSRVDGTRTPREAEAAISDLSPQQTVEDLRAGFAYLQKYPDVDPGRISSIGFGWGGWRSFKLAATLPDLYRAVIFYGATPVEGLQNVHASVLANYAQYDFFDTGNSIWTEDTFKQFGGKFTYYVYPKTYRRFFDPDAPHYDAEAAKLAWTRTLDFLQSQ